MDLKYLDYPEMYKKALSFQSELGEKEVPIIILGLMKFFEA